MILERVFYVGGGRVVKIIVRGRFTRNRSEMTIDFELLIKETNDIDFRQPIGENHPKYWKFKNSDFGRSQLLQLQYSGISKKQLKEAIEAFKIKAGTGLHFSYKDQIDAKAKYLKGMRTSALSKRISTPA
ncbi:hypothetical protein [Dyadobacter sp. NIV53]|uniref:hypothetical protein n=1 Tax=Dyadobacter sp. NIV53 TaxID=2861765 RepID=UPI001C8848C8|nr:hypothetical protein [Dyadobacter sp. NIV53]